MSDHHNIPQKNRTYSDSFKYAFIGIRTVFKEERNMRTHVLIGVVTILISLILGLSRVEWILILLSVFLVLVMEIWNTVIENIVDLVTGKQFHPIAKKAKDMAAAAVLLTAFFSLVMAGFIFIPKLLLLIP